MNLTIIKHEISQHRKSLLIWTAIVGGMSAMMIFMYPAVKDQMQEMAASYANMGGFSEAFGLDKINIGDLMGFYGVEAGAILALAGAMFASFLGSSVLAKEEGLHTAEFLYTHPISRSQVLISKLVFVCLQVLIFNVICFVVALVSMELIQESYDMNLLLLFHVAQVLMHLQLAVICFGLSAFTKKANIGIGLGFSALLYFVNLFINVSKNLNWMKYITPFHYADAPAIFVSEQLDFTLIGIGMGCALVCLLVGFRRFVSKDIGA